LKEVESPLPTTTQSCPKRAIEDTSGENTVSQEINLLEYWSKEGRWPKEYFELESDMKHLLAKKKLSLSLRRKQLEAGSVTPSSSPSDQKLREIKSTPYQHACYETVLATHSSYMDESDEGIIGRNEDLQELLSAEQLVPDNSLFRDDLFKSTCQKLRYRNEMRLIRDISLLIIPSIER
jgi:hypothetical protein